jgi:hypothetical protein
MIKIRFIASEHHNQAGNVPIIGSLKPLLTFESFSQFLNGIMLDVINILQVQFISTLTPQVPFKINIQVNGMDEYVRTDL